ncbi:8-amino-7-oxononanoate synthase, partial [Candidatus Poribacteria bacterium]|nr:8-amino-7-oxononanoate synthase [Candidatus Poribacteria bacterium]
MIWDNELRAELEALDRVGLTRRLATLESATGPRAMLDGRDVLMFGSNNYLGLAGDPRVREAAIAATQELGVGSGGSRLLSGNLTANRDLEADIAAFKGCPAAVIFASGYAANVGSISALVGRGDLVVSDALNHASIIDGCRLSRAETRVYLHADVSSAAEALSTDRGSFRRALIVTDGVFSVDGDIAPLADLCELAHAHSAALYVDDAHGVGVLGDGGRGTANHAGIEDDVSLIQMGTLSKAFGSVGGYVAASDAVVETLRQRARALTFSHGLPAAALSAAQRSLQILRDKPSLVTTLRDRSSRLREGLRERGLRVNHGETPIVPVVVGDADAATRLAAECLARALYAPAIRPPTVPGGTSR